MQETLLNRDYVIINPKEQSKCAGIGDKFFENYNEVLNRKGGFSQEITATSMFINSFIMAFGIATVKVIISAMSAYAIVYFRFKLATPIFWLIFITLLVAWTYWKTRGNY